MSGTPHIVEKVIWAPQEGPQEALIECPYPLIGFGGARGGGKTDGVLGKFALKEQRYGKRFNAVFFRMEMPQADDLIERARNLYEPLGARYNQLKNQFQMPNGGRVRFRPLENEKAAEKYQGQNLSDAAVEEAGNYPNPRAIFKLFGALRSAGGIPAQLILTFNPMGVGHGWLKNGDRDPKRGTLFPGFIKPAPLGFAPLTWKTRRGKEVRYVFIPSKVGDNRILLANDPEYIDRLHLVGGPELVRAWLEGDWEVLEGSYFPEFSHRHIVRAFPVPKHWHRYVGYDHGHHSRFCAVWGAVSSGKWDDGSESTLPDGRHIPKGAIVVYREYTDSQVQISQIAARIVELNQAEDPHMVADPSIFSHEGGPTIADQFKEVFAKAKGPVFREADNDRLSGWSQIRQRLGAPTPMLFFFETVPYLIETLPALAIDQKKPEDCDTTGDDHGADALRYLCKERLLDSTLILKSEPVKGGSVKIQDYIERTRARARAPRI